MPITYNGIGTKYYGKKNEHEHQGTCEFCNKYTTLRSYDTTKFFVFVYIPILPLGGKRVINECAICRRHRVVKLSEWEKMKREASEEIYNSWIQEPNDIEKARKLFESIIFFRNVELLNSLESDIRNNCMNNPEILKFWGEAHHFLNQFGEAERAFEASLSLKEDIEVKEELAAVLAKNLKPDRARNLITHIFDSANDSKLYYVLLLIESYQFIGDHSSALEIIDKTEEVFPGMKNDKSLKKYRKKSEKNYNTGKRVKGDLISGKSDKEKETSNYSFVIPKISALLLPIILILFYAIISFFMGLNRSVYVVNGLDTSYSIELNGEKVKLSPMSVEKIKVPEGTTKVNIVESDIVSGEFEFEINTPFWKRPLMRNLYILNPDKAAVLLWEETLYVADDYKGELPEYDESWFKYYTGRNFYEMDTVNLLFKEFPETMKIGSDTVRKTRLAQVRDTEIYSLADYLYILGSVAHEDVLSHIESKLTYNPDDEWVLQLFMLYQDQDKIIEFFQSKLDVRPILMNMHIYYQDYMELNNPSYNLKEEYTGYLENEEDNNELYYLLSRVEEDFDERIRLLNRSIEGDKPSAFGYYSLAFINHGMGNFEEAYEYIKKAVEIRENQQNFMYIMEEIMLSLKMYDDLLDRNEAFQKREPYNGDLVMEEVILHMSKGDTVAAQQAVTAYRNRIKESDEYTIQFWERYLKGIISYCSGDIHVYAALIEHFKDENPLLAFEYAFIRGDYNKAADIAINNELGSYYMLLLHLAESNPEKASEYLNYVIEEYKEQGSFGVKVAEYLSGEKEWTVEDIKELSEYAEQKLLILLALEKQKPAYREQLFELAGKLNYRIEFPYHFITNLLND